MACFCCSVSLAKNLCYRTEGLTGNVAVTYWVVTFVQVGNLTFAPTRQTNGVLNRIVNSAARSDAGQGEQQSSGGSGIDQTNWALSMGTLGLQASEGSFRLTNGAYNGSAWSSKYYASGWRGGSRARITTYNISKIGTAASRGLVIGGVLVDGYRWYKGDISGGKFGFNSGMAAFGMTGVGTIPAAFYFGMEAFYPGGLEGAMNDNARYQKEVDAIMNTGNKGTHFYILPWGAQKL